MQVARPRGKTKALLLGAIKNQHVNKRVIGNIPICSVAARTGMLGMKWWVLFHWAGTGLIGGPTTEQRHAVPKLQQPKQQKPLRPGTQAQCLDERFGADPNVPTTHQTFVGGGWQPSHPVITYPDPPRAVTRGCVTW